MSYSNSSQKSLIVESRFIWGGVAVCFLIALLALRLWYLQVYKGDYYYRVSENNRTRKIEIPAPRGSIYDRYGKIVLGNRPFFELVMIPQYVKEKEKTLYLLSRLLNIPYAKLKKTLVVNQGRPEFLPITLVRNLSIHEYAIIASNSLYLPGIEINIAPGRDYKPATPPHIVGYLSEIDKKTLQQRNESDPNNPYFPGDLIGQQGLEHVWETYLKGQRGYKIIQVDAFGRQRYLENNEAWQLPTKATIPGSDLHLTFDLDLQKAVIKAFQGKYGAVVVMDPNNGEILAMYSSPTFDPTIYQETLSLEKWRSLVMDPYKPLFDKTTGGTFAPGSTYKPVVALAGLEEGIINPKTTYFCPGSLDIGKDTFHCHLRGGHGVVDLEKALVKSCDVYFFHVGMELGIDRIAKYARDLGLGQRLGVNLNREEPGLIPTHEWKKKMSNSRWSMGDNASISIGQGANLMTPIQFVSLYATIANGGKVYRPFIVKRVANHMGENSFTHEPEVIHHSKLIQLKNFQLIQKYLGNVVETQEGTGKNARVKGVTVAGKTGSVQVVSLKKNRNRNSVVSMKWLEHAMFTAFSPIENAQVAIAVISENDKNGGGGASAAPVAQKIIEAFWRLKKRQPQPLQSISKKEP